MNNDERKLLQELQTHRGWTVLEKLMDEYIEGLDLKRSAKRSTEFETIWSRASSEGGELHLRTFFAVADGEARKYQYDI